LLLSRSRSESFQSLHGAHKRPIKVSKETYYSVKTDLLSHFDRLRGLIVDENIEYLEV